MTEYDKSEKISITLPAEMLSDIKEQVRLGVYASTSEVIREAMRLWQRNQQEHQARLQTIRARLERSASSGEPITMKDAFALIEQRHQQRLQSNHETL
jgi:antitoxin ParD1/3/4